MTGVEGLPDEAVQRLAAVLREPLDDGVLMHTGRSIGDLASERVAREAAAALAPVVAALVRESAAAELEAAAEVIDDDWTEQCCGNRALTCESCRTYEDVLRRLDVRAAALRGQS